MTVEMEVEVETSVVVEATRIVEVEAAMVDNDGGGGDIGGGRREDVGGGGSNGEGGRICRPYSTFNLIVTTTVTSIIFQPRSSISISSIDAHHCYT
ncbi:hypothetical protein LOK49_LG02G00358 [Camellia lanceoleosa]|uniref:Uncharacterized protein n=1 Tax=Camellia lanceoleosa TaxID=1840588 RepID=A0ACC0IJ20_9ERIC|nr:hypothetical protein LOK49_LG02G00358 [Camellia lanceoleosa]